MLRLSCAAARRRAPAWAAAAHIQPRAAAHGHSHGDSSSCSHAHGPAELEPAAAVAEAAKERALGAGLPLAERCRALLQANWRAQLSSVVDGPRAGDQPAIHGSLVPFALLPDDIAMGRLAPILALQIKDSPTDLTHARNLQADPRCSLTLGGTDPPAVAATLRAYKAAGYLPRVSLLGDARELQFSDAEYARARLRRQLTARAAGGPVEPALAALATARLFTLDVEQVRYVAAGGAQFQLPPGVVADAPPDPLAPHLGGLLSAQFAPAARGRLAELCISLAGLSATRDAVMIGADRLGLNVASYSLIPRSVAGAAAAPASEPAAQGGVAAVAAAEAEAEAALMGQWEAVRFQFTKPATDVLTFEAFLEQMHASLGGLQGAAAAGPEGVEKPAAGALKDV